METVAIETCALSRTFGARKAVDAVDLEVKSGELFSLLGHNGAGKTTIIKMLCCLLRPTSGTARVLGHDLATEQNAIKQLTGVSPQETAIAGHLTVMENLLLMAGLYGLDPAESRARADHLVEMMGLQDRLKEQVRSFSGGLQRKLSIAMALVSDPKLLFLDEPTLGLDPKARRALWQEIERLKATKTIILTTHYLEEADALSDRLAILRDGRVVATGTPAELKSSLIGGQMMLVKGRGIDEATAESLASEYLETKLTGEGLEIRGSRIVFEEVVDRIRASGARIDWVTMKEPSLDDVYLSLSSKEMVA